jgi:hypothetical protein
MENDKPKKLCLEGGHGRPAKLDHISPEQLAYDRERMSVGYMARHYGVCKATMYRYLRRAGLVKHDESES